jgi:hypothetical protein
MGNNVSTLGEEADLKAHTFSLVKKPIGSTNVQFSTKTAFLPSVCYNQCFLRIINLKNKHNVKIKQRI